MNIQELQNSYNLLCRRVEKLEDFVMDYKILSIKKDSDTIGINEAAIFLNYTKSTIYTKVSKKELPCFKRGKSLFFSKSQLTAYLQSGVKVSVTDACETEKQNKAKNTENRISRHAL